MIADHDGNVLGRGAAAGGNPTSHPETAAANFGRAVQAALAGIDPAAVQAAVIGTAGGTALGRPGVQAQFDAAWSGSGLTIEPRFIGDLEVAFASGTPEPNGTVLIAGTGSNAGLVHDHQLVRTAGGTAGCSVTTGRASGSDGRHCAVCCALSISASRSVYSAKSS